MSDLWYGVQHAEQELRLAIELQETIGWDSLLQRRASIRTKDTWGTNTTNSILRSSLYSDTTHNAPLRSHGSSKPSTSQSTSSFDTFKSSTISRDRPQNGLDILRAPNASETLNKRPTTNTKGGTFDDYRPPDFDFSYKSSKASPTLASLINMHSSPAQPVQEPSYGPQLHRPQRHISTTNEHSSIFGESSHHPRPPVAQTQPRPTFDEKQQLLDRLKEIDNQFEDLNRLKNSIIRRLQYLDSKNDNNSDEERPIFRTNYQNQRLATPTTPHEIRADTPTSTKFDRPQSSFGPYVPSFNSPTHTRRRLPFDDKPAISSSPGRPISPLGLHSPPIEPSVGDEYHKRELDLTRQLRALLTATTSQPIQYSQPLSQQYSSIYKSSETRSSLIPSTQSTQSVDRQSDVISKRSTIKSSSFPNSYFSSDPYSNKSLPSTHLPNFL